MSHKLEVTRTVNAPIEKVFKAFIDPEEMKQWYVHRGLTIPEAETEVKIGGKYTVTMVEPNNEVHTAIGKFKEIDEPHKLVYSWNWKEYKMDVDSEITVLFEKIEDSKTKITLIHDFLPSEQSVKDHSEGWTMIMDHVVEYFN